MIGKVHIRFTAYGVQLVRYAQPRISKIDPPRSEQDRSFNGYDLLCSVKSPTFLKREES
jgi:hypothetical protein